ncbi:MAG: hypothetical protein KF753_02850 [Caldilineaceae bacterium]|nr:hypothetical protein [Caldilineaceae bacterium]
MTTIFDLFRSCVLAIGKGALIQRESSQDKEFHFQHWVRERISETSHMFEEAGRNSYPDFRIVHLAEGYEVKGLAYPGRWLNYDSNSQVPTGFHNGRTVYYVFGRYPKQPDGDSYPVLDLVLCHGDFLNADHEYVHENKAVRGFGSYGDILIRDRKMYVAPTPYGLLDGTAHHQTLIIPSEQIVPDGFQEVGQIIRTEVAEIVIKYTFDLRTNELHTEKIPNPNAGRQHIFRALRLIDGLDTPVVLRNDVAADDLNDGDTN